MRIKLIPLLVAVLMLLSACSSTNDSAPDPKTEPESPASASPVVPDGYRLAEDGESPDAYINEDGSIITDPYDDNGNVSPGFWGVMGNGSAEDSEDDEGNPVAWGVFYGDGESDASSEVPFYDLDYMSSERAQYRLTTAQASPDYSWINGYNDVMRNIKSIYGDPGKASGSILWVDRNGFTTNFGIKTGGGILDCYIETDLPVIKGDYITVYGSVREGSYIQTNEYGVSTEISCPHFDVDDYYLGGTGGLLNTFNDSPDSMMQSGAVDLSTVLPEYLLKTWFDHAIFYAANDTDGERSAEITLETINGFPYTIKKWFFNEETERLILGVWLDDYIDNYYDPSIVYTSTPVNRYTVLELQENEISLYTTDERGGYRNITEGSDITLSDEESRLLYYAHDLKVGYLA